MTNQEIIELLKIFKESDVAEMEVQRGDNRLRLRRGGETVREVAVPAAMPVAVPAVAAAPQIPSPPTAEAPSTDVEVKSPIVGTFYEAASPDSPPFVRVGDRVQPGQVLCIIESMKLMNEIEAEIGGVITARLIENGRPVEYGETLFSIRP